MSKNITERNKIQRAAQIDTIFFFFIYSNILNFIAKLISKFECYSIHICTKIIAFASAVLPQIF